jgi:hypothetical protein
MTPAARSPITPRVIPLETVMRWLCGHTASMTEILRAYRLLGRLLG